MSAEEVMWWVRVGLKVVGYVGLLVGVVSVVCSYLITSYGTFTSFEVTPGDFGFGYERFVVEGAGGARIACWAVPAEGARGVVIASHGIADSKQGILPYVVKIREAGYTLVLYDMRHHGESSGRHCTLGYYETEDLARVTARVRSEYAGGKPLFYWGFSLGGTVSMLAAARDEGVMGVVAQSPFPSMREVVRHYVWRFYRLPPEPLVWLGLKIMEWRTGARVDEVNVRRVADKLRGRPVLLIGSKNDRQVPVRWLEEMRAALGEGAELVIGPYGHEEVCMGNGETEDVLGGIELAIKFFDRLSEGTGRTKG